MPRIRVHVLHCGRIGVAPDLPASGQWRWPAKADARRTKADARIWLPVSAYLVEHPKGLFLVDAGLPRTVSPTGVEDRAAQLRMFGGGWYTGSCTASSARAVDRRTAGRARHPAAGSGLCALFPPRPGSYRRHQRGAGRKAPARAGGGISGRAASTCATASRRLWIDEPPERFWYRVNHIGPESRSYDLFGDDSVHLVHIAGHTEGMFAALIRNGERYVLLNADGAQVPAHGRRARCPVSAKTVCAPKRRSTGSAA